MKILLITSLIGLSALSAISAATDSQRITVDEKMQVPGTTLKAGEYLISVEDRLQDRAIVRIENARSKAHELLLAVPSEKLSSAGSGELIFFPNGDSNKKVLQGWMCGSCKVALEFVYPKAEAVKITGVSAKPVLAVDPTYDKLPKNLSPDDMKVVTLWLLSPKEITADQKGKGVEAAKVADLKKQTETASASPTAPTPVTGSEVAANSQPPASPAPAPDPAVAAAQAPAPAGSATPEATPQAQTPSPTPAVPAATAEPAAPVAPPVSVAPVQTASASTSPDTKPSAHSRRMPHTASNAYEFGALGILLLAGGVGLQLQRRRQSSLDPQ